MPLLSGGVLVWKGVLFMVVQHKLSLPATPRPWLPELPGPQEPWEDSLGPPCEALSELPRSL